MKNGLKSTGVDERPYTFEVFVDRNTRETAKGKLVYMEGSSLILA